MNFAWTNPGLRKFAEEEVLVQPFVEEIKSGVSGEVLQTMQMRNQSSRPHPFCKSEIRV